MNCRICNRECQPLFKLDNMPANNQHLSDKPDSKGITLNVVQCKGCGLVQLDNEPVWYWKEVIRSSRLSEKINVYAESVDSFNVLEHQPNPNEYLKGFLGYEDPIVIDVPNCRDMNTYDFCIDHLMYFTEETLWTAIELNGFEVNDIIEKLGGICLEAAMYKREPFDTYDRFDYIKLHHFLTKHNPIGIYGAGHQSFALLSHDEMLSKQTKCVIDDNSAKQGKYTPATNIPIVQPDALNGLDAIIVMAGGYSDEVLKKLDDFKGSVAVLRGNKLEVVR
jgi:hypothetical protein